MTIGTAPQLPLFPGLAASDFVAADVETTGLDPSADRVVEFSLLRFSGGLPKARFSALVDPFQPIPPTASAVHLLTNRHVSGRPSLNDFAADMHTFVGDLPVVAHNAEFDRAFLPMLEGPWICTLRLARRLWPRAPKHTNQVLRFWLNLDDDYDLTSGMPHRAEADALVTGHLFVRELETLEMNASASTVEEVTDLCWGPIPVETFRYGRKHRDALITDIPIDYLLWVDAEQSKPDGERKLSVDADTQAAIKLEIMERWWPQS